MTSGTLIWRNLGRNKRRTGLTLAAVALSLFLLTLLGAVVGSMRGVARSAASELRLVVHERTTITKMLPVGYQTKIAALPRVRAVCAVRWLGGCLPDSAAQFPSLAADPAAFPVVYADFALTPDELAAWRQDRTTAIIGAELARRMDWIRGQRVTLQTTIPPYLTLDFRIGGITAAPAYPNLLAVRLDYVLDAVREHPDTPAEIRDAANFFFVQVATPADLEPVRAAIDALFAQSPERTRTQSEATFVTQFVLMFGDVPHIVGVVGGAVVIALLLVVANTMAMALRERVSEFAVLRAIGFSPPRLLAIVAGESLLLAAAGGLAGCGAAWLVSGNTLRAGLMMPYFPVVNVSAVAIGQSLAAALVAGLLASLAPARAVLRMPLAGALRDTG